jgi:hypothetical protein
VSSNGKMLDAAYRDLDSAKDRVHRAMLDCLPIGCCATWVVTRNGTEYRQFGEVKRHGYDDTIFVLNDRTLKLRRLSAYQLEFVHGQQYAAADGEGSEGGGG